MPHSRSVAAPGWWIPVVAAALLALTLVVGCAGGGSPEPAVPAAAASTAADAATVASTESSAAASSPAAAATKPPAAAPKPPATPAPVAADDPVNDLESLTPPDGKWLVDDDGREFFVTRLPKVEGTFVRPREGVIVYRRWYQWPYVKEDDKYFYVKVFRPLTAEEDEAIVAPRRQELADRKAEREKSYRFQDQRVDRLEFSSFDQGLPREGQWRQGFDVADMNGDGHLDIVHGPPRKGYSVPVVFLGDGNGHWRLWSEAVWPRLPYDYGDATAGDINGDGRMDIGLGVHLRGLIALIQVEPGRFEDASKGLFFEMAGGGSGATGFSSRAVEFLDWNDDGRLDLIALGEGARSSTSSAGAKGIVESKSYGLAIFLNNGDRTWLPLSGGGTEGVFGDTFAMGDFNGDRRMDIVSSSNAMGARGILFLKADTPQGWEQKDLDTIRERAWTFAVTAGDFTDDGKADLVASFGTHEDQARWGLELSFRDRESAWQKRVLWVEEGVGASWALASGDLDGDGHRDVVAIKDDGTVFVFLGDGKGSFAREESPELDAPTNCRGYAVRLVDLDGDGVAELLASFAGETGETEKLMGLPTCEGEGALRAWRASKKTAARVRS